MENGERMTPNERPPTDYRKSRREDDRAQLILVVIVLLGVGTTLIGLIWGWGAAITGGVCLFAGVALITILWLLLTLIEKWVAE